MPSDKRLILKSNGEVAETQLGFDVSSFKLSSYGTDRVLVVDQALPEVVASYLVPSVGFSFDAVTSTVVEVPTQQTRNVNINPLTEQLVSGKIEGQFQLSETAYQTTIVPTIVNNYVVGGETLSTFVPTIGTIGVSGEIGIRSAQFLGTLNDVAAQKASGISLPPFTTTASTPYFLLDGWMYLEQEPSNNYDPIIVTRSADGINNSTNDSFRLEYDTTSDQVQFHYSDSSYAPAGYRGIVNVSPSGISLNKWNKFAVAWVSAGGSASIKTYWNGTSLYTAAGLCGFIRNSTSSVMIGSGISGDKPLKGWLQDVHLRMGGTTLSLASHAFLGSTVPINNEKSYAGDATIYLFSGRGYIGTSNFPVDNLCRVTGTVSYIDNPNGVLGMALVGREDSDVTNLTLFSGVCGGFSETASNVGYVFGNESGSCMKINGVTQLQSLADSKTVRKNAMDFTVAYLRGATVMSGYSGSAGDFVNLFTAPATWINGQTYSFLPTQSNMASLRNFYDNIVVSGYNGITVLEDSTGTPFNFATGGVIRLYQDVVTFHSDMNIIRTGVNAQVNAAASFTALKAIPGATTAVLERLASTNLSSAGGLFIPPTARMTKKTSIPETTQHPLSTRKRVGESVTGSLTLE